MSHPNIKTYQESDIVQHTELNQAYGYISRSFDIAGQNFLTNATASGSLTYSNLTIGGTQKHNNLLITSGSVIYSSSLAHFRLTASAQIYSTGCFHSFGRDTITFNDETVIGLNQGTVMYVNYGSFITFDKLSEKTIKRFSIPQVIILPSLGYRTFFTATFDGMYFNGNASTTNFNARMAIPPGVLTDKATLDEIKVYFSTQGTHAALPVLMPSIEIERHNIEPGMSNATEYLSTSPQQYCTTPTVGAYNGAVNEIKYTCNQNNIIDLGKYEYYVYIHEEGGPNAYTTTADANLWRTCVVSQSIGQLRI